MAPPNMSRVAAFVWILGIYVVATLVGLAVASWGSGRPLWEIVALGDGAATLVVFLFSVLFDNSSVYDPYWSVAPLVIAPALASVSTLAVPPLRKVLVLVLVLCWGVRLTWNWSRNWRGFEHEDWRYVEHRKPGRPYWLVSFVGFHLLPTVWVYLGCLSLLPALVTGTHPLSILDVLAFAVTAGAVVLETVADEQMRGFRLTNQTPGRIMDEGVWALCRHPNYLGEIGFWWGLWLFALAADPSSFWTLVGPVSITMMFVFISTPLIDRRSALRRPGYSVHMERVPALLPRFLGRRARRQVEP